MFPYSSAMLHLMINVLVFTRGIQSAIYQPQDRGNPPGMHPVIFQKITPGDLHPIKTNPDPANSGLKKVFLSNKQVIKEVTTQPQAVYVPTKVHKIINPKIVPKETNRKIPVYIPRSRNFINTQRPETNFLQFTRAPTKFSPENTKQELKSTRIPFKYTTESILRGLRSTKAPIKSTLRERTPARLLTKFTIESTVQSPKSTKAQTNFTTESTQRELKDVNYPLQNGAVDKNSKSNQKRCATKNGILGATLNNGGGEGNHNNVCCGFLERLLQSMTKMSSQCGCEKMQKLLENNRNMEEDINNVQNDAVMPSGNVVQSRNMIKDNEEEQPKGVVSKTRPIDLKTRNILPKVTGGYPYKNNADPRLAETTKVTMEDKNPGALNYNDAPHLSVTKLPYVTSTPSEFTSREIPTNGREVIVANSVQTYKDEDSSIIPTIVDPKNPNDNLEELGRLEEIKKYPQLSITPATFPANLYTTESFSELENLEINNVNNENQPSQIGPNVLPEDETPFLSNSFNSDQITPSGNYEAAEEKYEGINPEFALVLSPIRSNYESKNIEGLDEIQQYSEEEIYPQVEVEPDIYSLPVIPINNIDSENMIKEVDTDPESEIIISNIDDGYVSRPRIADYQTNLINFGNDFEAKIITERSAVPSTLDDGNESEAANQENNIISDLPSLSAGRPDQVATSAESYGSMYLPDETSEVPYDEGLFSKEESSTLGMEKVSNELEKQTEQEIPSTDRSLLEEANNIIKEIDGDQPTERYFQIQKKRIIEETTLKHVIKGKTNSTIIKSITSRIKSLKNETVYKNNGTIQINKNTREHKSKNNKKNIEINIVHLDKNKIKSFEDFSSETLGKVKPTEKSNDLTEVSTNLPEVEARYSTANEDEDPKGTDKDDILAEKQATEDKSENIDTNTKSLFTESSTNNEKTESLVENTEATLGSKQNFQSEFTTTFTVVTPVAPEYVENDQERPKVTPLENEIQEEEFDIPPQVYSPDLGVFNTNNRKIIEGTLPNQIFPLTEYGIPGDVKVDAPPQNFLPELEDLNMRNEETLPDQTLPPTENEIPGVVKVDAPPSFHIPQLGDFNAENLPDQTAPLAKNEEIWQIAENEIPGVVKVDAPPPFYIPQLGDYNKETLPDQTSTLAENESFLPELKDFNTKNGNINEGTLSYTPTNSFEQTISPELASYDKKETEDDTPKEIPSKKPSQYYIPEQDNLVEKKTVEPMGSISDLENTTYLPNQLFTETPVLEYSVPYLSSENSRTALDNNGLVPKSINGDIDELRNIINDFQRKELELSEVPNENAGSNVYPENQDNILRYNTDEDTGFHKSIEPESADKIVSVEEEKSLNNKLESTMKSLPDKETKNFIQAATPKLPQLIPPVYPFTSTESTTKDVEDIIRTFLQPAVTETQAEGNKLGQDEDFQRSSKIETSSVKDITYSTLPPELENTGKISNLSLEPNLQNRQDSKQAKTLPTAQKDESHYKQDIFKNFLQPQNKDPFLKTPEIRKKPILPNKDVLGKSGIKTPAFQSPTESKFKDEIPGDINNGNDKNIGEFMYSFNGATTIFPYVNESSLILVNPNEEAAPLEAANQVKATKDKENEGVEEIQPVKQNKVEVAEGKVLKKGNNLGNDKKMLSPFYKRIQQDKAPTFRANQKNTEETLQDKGIVTDEPQIPDVLNEMERSSILPGLPRDIIVSPFLTKHKTDEESAVPKQVNLGTVAPNLDSFYENYTEIPPEVSYTNSDNADSSENRRKDFPSYYEISPVEQVVSNGIDNKNEGNNIGTKEIQGIGKEMMTKSDFFPRAENNLEQQYLSTPGPSSLYDVSMQEQNYLTKDEPTTDIIEASTSFPRMKNEKQETFTTLSPRTSLDDLESTKNELPSFTEEPYMAKGKEQENEIPSDFMPDKYETPSAPMFGEKEFTTSHYYSKPSELPTRTLDTVTPIIYPETYSTSFNNADENEGGTTSGPRTDNFLPPLLSSPIPLYLQEENIERNGENWLNGPKAESYITEDQNNLGQSEPSNELATKGEYHGSICLPAKISLSKVSINDKPDIYFVGDNGKKIPLQFKAQNSQNPMSILFNFAPKSKSGNPTGLLENDKARIFKRMDGGRYESDYINVPINEDRDKRENFEENYEDMVEQTVVNDPLNESWSIQTQDGDEDKLDEEMNADSLPSKNYPRTINTLKNGVTFGDFDNVENKMRRKEALKKRKRRRHRSNRLDLDKFGEYPIKVDKHIYKRFLDVYSDKSASQEVNSQAPKKGNRDLVHNVYSLVKDWF